jgi:hypothetical protein
MVFTAKLLSKGRYTMKRSSIFFFVAVLLIGFAFHAQAVEVFQRDDVRLNMGIKGQIWSQAVEDAAPSGEDWSKDFSIKQVRIYTSGAIMNGLKFGANFDFNNSGFVDGKKGASDTSLTDGFLSFDSVTAFQVLVGKYRAAFSRYALTDSYTAYPFPHAPFAADAKLASGAGGYRMTGLTAWGMLGRKFRYNLALADGTPEGLNGENDSKDSLQYLSRVEFFPLGEDKGYVHANQWLGKKKLVTIGAGYTTKRYDRVTGATVDNVTYKAWTVDGYAELPLPSESAITGEAAYYNYDKDTPTNPGSKAYFVQAGYLLPGQLGPGKLQSVARFEEIRRDGIENNTSSWAGGINYYLKDHNAKVMVEYLSVNNQNNANTFSGTAGKDRDAVTLVLSFGI